MYFCKAEATQVTVTVDEYGLDSKLENKLYLGGQVALDMLFNVPCMYYYVISVLIHSYYICILITAGSGSSDLTIEAIPDFENLEISMRICKVTLYDVKKNLIFSFC